MNGPTIPVHIIFDEPSSSIVFDYTANAIISAVTLDLFDDDNIQIGSTTVELVPTPGSLGGVGFVEFTADVPFRTAIVTTTPTTTGVGFLLDNLRFGYQPVGGDPDPTNELQTLTLDGADLSLSRNGGTVSINDADPDPVNETNQSLDFDGTTLSISDASGTLARDLSSLRDDADADPANEKVSAFALDPDGTTLRLTEAGESRTVDLSAFLPPPDGDSDPTNELQTLSQVGSSFVLSGGGSPVPLNPNIVITGTPNDSTGVGINSLINNTGHDNSAVGHSATRENTSGTTNAAMGAGALLQNSTGSRNTAFGGLALHTNSTGTNNTAVGARAITQILGGSNNIGIGHAAGTSAPLNANGNIFIGSQGDSSDTGNTIRIGGDFHTRTFLAGVAATSLTATVKPVVIDSAGQLGTIDSTTRTFAARITMDSTSCTATHEYGGDWIAAIDKGGTGECEVFWTERFDESPPICTCTPEHADGITHTSCQLRGPNIGPQIPLAEGVGLIVAKINNPSSGIAIDVPVTLACTVP